MGSEDVIGAAQRQPPEEHPPVDVLVVRVAGRRVALPLESVQQVLPAVAPEPLPGAPEVIRGVVNLHGELLPLLDLRARLGLPDGSLDPDHHLVACAVAGRTVALHVDEAETVAQLPPQELIPAHDLPATEHLTGAAVTDDGLVFVYDVRSFLAADEVLQLDVALAGDRDQP